MMLVVLVMIGRDKINLLTMMLGNLNGLGQTAGFLTLVRLKRDMRYEV